MDNMPNFAAWSKEALEQFSAESFSTMCEQQDTIEQLRLNNKDLSKLLRKQITLGEPHDPDSNCNGR